MRSKLADESRKALIAEARRLKPEERLWAFARHSKLVTELSKAGKLARSLRSKRPQLLGRDCSISVTDETGAGICVIPIDDI